MDEKLIIEPGKLVTKFEDIEEIVKAVSERMDEPGLNSKNINKNIKVYPQDRFISVFKVIEKIYLDLEKLTEEQYPVIDAFCFRSHFTGDYHIFIKSNIFSLVFTSYYHELGHIANDEFVNNDSLQKSGLSVGPLLTIREASADAFMFWALEELNQISDLNHPGGFYTCHKAKESLLSLEDHLKPNDARVAANDLLLWLYASDKNHSSKGVYNWLCDYIRDKERLSILGELVSKHFLNKK